MSHRSAGPARDFAQTHDSGHIPEPSLRLARRSNPDTLPSLDVDRGHNTSVRSVDGLADQLCG
jgi:hypothetical protein